VVEATYNGLTARASVVTGSPIQSDNISGNLDGTQALVDAAEAAWDIPSALSPAGFAVTAQPGDGSTSGNAEVVNVPATATHAYLPNLLPGESYTLTVYAVGTGGGILGSASGVVPLSPLPEISAGTGQLEDVATNPTTGKPDDTGEAGNSWPFEGASAISGNGEYAFFYTQARSNLAPASIYNPASTDVYLLRKNLLTGEIDVASIGLNGTPVSAFPDTGPPLASSDGSSVVFYMFNVGGDLQPEVYDFTTETGWLVGAAGDDGDLVDGISSNGQVVAYETLYQEENHAYRQAAGGVPQQIDSCPVATADTCAQFYGEVSMSDDGNLIAYTAGAYEDLSTSGSVPGPLDIYLYNATTGTDTAVFPRTTCYYDNESDAPYQCLTYDDPVLSGDGSTLVVEESSAIPTVGPTYLSLFKVGSQDGTKIATDDANDYYKPVALSDNGGVLLYSDQYGTTLTYQIQLREYGTGGSQAPQLGGNTPTSLASASLSANGLDVLYTLVQLSDDNNPNDWFISGEYPGVYLWTP
jgi:hypothetical protein